MNQGCERESENFDTKITNELLLTIFPKKEDGLSTKCISENLKSNYLNSLPDFENYIITELQIKDLNHYKQQFELFSNFKINPELFPNMHIISEKQVEIYDESLSDEKIKKIRLINENCEYGYYSISKPIFNEDYNLAIVEFINHCGGGLCGGGRTAIYEYKDGFWKEMKVLDSWIG